MEWPFRAPRLTMFLLHWHFIQVIVCGFNWRWFISKEESMLGPDLPRFHIAFDVIGLLSFLLVSSVLIYWPYRYGAYMLPKSRRNKMMLGLAIIYFFHVLPLWMVEFSIVWSYGWFVLIQSVSFVFLTISWCVETVGVWYAYIWHMSGFMNRNYGTTVLGIGAKKDDDAIRADREKEREKANRY
jgi:hypothetical protein